MKQTTIFVTLYLFFGFTGSCLAGQTWYPKASDRCATYVLETVSRDGGKLVTPTKDVAIGKLINDFNTATGIHDEGGMALIYLLGYCNTHGVKNLGDVSLDDLMTDYKQTEFKNKIEKWYQQTLAFCESNVECVGIATNSRNHAISCAARDQQACSDKDRDMVDMNQFNSRLANSSLTSSQSSTNNSQSCLQNTAKFVADMCANSDQCSGGNFLPILKTVQEGWCGYSAIKIPQSTTP